MTVTLAVVTIVAFIHGTWRAFAGSISASRAERQRVKDVKEKKHLRRVK